MIVVILSWIYYFLLCMAIGLGIERLLTKILKGKWKFQTIDHTVTGIVGITIYAAFFSIFYKVGMIAHLILLLKRQETTRLRFLSRQWKTLCLFSR